MNDTKKLMKIEKRRCYSFIQTTCGLSYIHFLLCCLILTIGMLIVKDHKVFANFTAFSTMKQVLPILVICNMWWCICNNCTCVITDCKCVITDCKCVITDCKCVITDWQNVITDWIFFISICNYWLAYDVITDWIDENFKSLCLLPTIIWWVPVFSESHFKSIHHISLNKNM